MTTTQTKTDYKAIAAFDLQQYVDSLTSEEKVKLFKNLSHLQNYEADALWLENHNTYPYSDEFMEWYVSEKYAAFIDTLFVEPEDSDSTVIRFTYQSGRTRWVTPISNLMPMPEDYLIKMTMRNAGINPDKVQEHHFLQREGWYN